MKEDEFISIPSASEPVFLIEQVTMFIEGGQGRLTNSELFPNKLN
jgi:hypothetical protein